MGTHTPSRIVKSLYITSFICLALNLGGCTKKVRSGSVSPQGASESELLSLRRENASLRQEMELMRDQELMCHRQGAPVKTSLAPVKLSPNKARVARTQSPVRPRGVSLQDLPNSAPDADVMARYAASAAPGERQAVAQDPKRYRLVGSEKARPAKRRRAKVKAAPKVSVETLYRQARDFYKQGDRARARALFSRIEDDFPESDLADNAAYWKAEDDLDAGSLAKAQAGFMRILSEYPTGNKVEDAMFMLGFCYKKQAQFERAHAMFTNVAKAGRPELKKKARKELHRLAKLRVTQESMNGR